MKMPKYKVTLWLGDVTYPEIEAEDEDSAIDIALAKLGDGEDGKLQELIELASCTAEELKGDGPDDGTGGQ